MKVIQRRHLESSLVSMLFRTECVINGHVLALTVRNSAIMPNSVYIRRTVMSSRDYTHELLHTGLFSFRKTT